MKKVYRIYLDDRRIAPKGWFQARWPEDVIKILKSGTVNEISLDHDLGDDERGTGYDVITWIEEQVISGNLIDIPKIKIHTSNPSARMKMEAGVRKIKEILNK